MENKKSPRPGLTGDFYFFSIKNRLFWLGAFAYFVGDLITTAIGLQVGAQELNPFIKSLPYMVLAKVGVLLFLFGVLKYLEYMKLKSEHQMIIKSSNILHKFIVLWMASLGIGIGVINNIIIIRGFI